MNPEKPRKDVQEAMDAITALGDRIYQMTNIQIGAEIGRNADTVAATLKRMGIVRDARKIAAEQQRADHGQPGKWIKCDCEICAEARRTYKHDDYVRRQASLSADEFHRRRAETRATLSARQARTAATAKSSGRRWTGHEVEQAVREDLTIEQIAAQLRRTYAAVSNVRKALADPDDPAHARYVSLLGYDPSER